MLSRSDASEAISDIRALVSHADPAQPDVDEATRIRLAAIQRHIASQPPAADGGRRWWWPSRSQRRRRRVVIGCVAVPALLAASAAGWAIVSSPPATRIVNGVACYSGRFDPGTGLDHSSGIAVAVSNGTAPTRVCAHYWAIGSMEDNAHSHFVPRLVACSLPPPRHPEAAATMGAVGVFPDTTCAKLHLAPLPPGYDQAARRLAALDMYLRAGPTRGCVTEPAIAAYAGQALGKFDFHGWRVTTPWGTKPWKGSRGGGCWEAQTDAPGYAIQVLPAP